MESTYIVWALALIDEQNSLSGRVLHVTRGVAVFSPMMFSEVLA